MVSSAKSANIAALVLASGQSSRFGSDKRRYLLHGEPMLQLSLSKPLALKIPTMLTLKPEDENQLSNLLGRYQMHPLLHICYVEHAEQGMALSLGQGVASIHKQFKNIDGVMILLADMPWIKCGTIEQLIRHYTKEKIIISCYQGASEKIKRGHPILFCKHWFKRLSEITGDIGARSLINQNERSVIDMIVKDQGVIADLDQPD
jgi:molybdenum cofactor cytidylyltransferase